MAIIIEEEKKKFNWFALASVILVVALIAVAVYYLFFAPVPLIERVTPLSLQPIQELSGITLQPEAIVNNPKFQVLKAYVNPITIGPVGKSNPFLR